MIFFSVLEALQAGFRLDKKTRWGYEACQNTPSGVLRARVWVAPVVYTQNISGKEKRP